MHILTHSHSLSPLSPLSLLSLSLSLSLQASIIPIFIYCAITFQVSTVACCHGNYARHTSHYLVCDDAVQCGIRERPQVASRIETDRIEGFSVLDSMVRHIKYYIILILIYSGRAQD